MGMGGDETKRVVRPVAVTKLKKSNESDVMVDCKGGGGLGMLVLHADKIFDDSLHDSLCS